VPPEEGVRDGILPRTAPCGMGETVMVMEDDAELKVLFITGYAEQAILRNGFLAPGMELITRPFALDALGAKIRELIES